MESSGTARRKLILTRSRSGRLSSVFTTGSGKSLNQHVARVCVLFEDLRIEISGIAEEQLEALDQDGRKARQIYFLRRSIGTLHEFTEALCALDTLPEFAAIRKRFSPIALKHWNGAVRYLRKHEKAIARVRHHVGGHFGLQAAIQAVENLLPDAVGSVEISLFSQGGGGARLMFASELAATAMVRNVRGHDSEDKVRRLIRMAVVAYRHAVHAVDCVTVAYLWDRFGK